MEKLTVKFVDGVKAVDKKNAQRTSPGCTAVGKEAEALFQQALNYEYGIRGMKQEEYVLCLVMAWHSKKIGARKRQRFGCTKRLPAAQGSALQRETVKGIVHFLYNNYEYIIPHHNTLLIHCYACRSLGTPNNLGSFERP